MPRGVCQKICKACSAEFTARTGNRFLCDPCRSVFHEIRQKAIAAVNTAIKAGQLQRLACTAIRSFDSNVCGRTPAHAHHEDYSRPLDVVWLCPGCHAGRHRELGGPGKFSHREVTP